MKEVKWQKKIRGNLIGDNLNAGYCPSGIFIH